MSKVRVIPQVYLFDTPAYDLVLASSGKGWCGTYEVMVRALVEDVLSDGSPITMRVTYEDEGGVQHTVEGLVPDYTPRQPALQVGEHSVTFDSIRQVEV